MQESFPDATVKAVLVVVHGELEGRVYPIRNGDNRIGRSETCDVVLASPKVSREHAVLVHDEGLFVIAPLSEANPTYLNEAVSPGGELADGDQLRLGRTTLRFRIVERG